KRVAIIGAGSAGFAALKTFVHDIPKPDGQRWEIDLFEQRNGLGGVWSDDSSARYPYLPETPLYPQLYTNTPVPTMTYPNFPFPPYTPLYPAYDRIQAYHQNFATHFNLYPYIHLNHSLESAYWVGNASMGFWELSISTNGRQEEIIPFNKTSTYNSRHRPRITRRFDHLVVANGHNHYPRIPSWATDHAANEWLRNGKGRNIVHSIYFREPEEYAGKIILVVGAGGSGVDIVTQSSAHAKKVYHSFSSHGRHAPPWEVPGTIYKPRTKGFTSSCVQFEDGTEVFDVELVILATGYDYRFPFLDPSDPYNRPTRGIPTRERYAIVTTNASALSRTEGERRLTENLNYLFPLDRQIVSLSSLHPLNALLFIGLPFAIPNAPSDIAQSIFAGHLIAQPDRTLARELLLRNLTAFENRLADEGFDVYVLGHKMNIGSYTDVEYQDSLIAHLQSQGLVPSHDGGYVFVEPWRIRAREKVLELRMVWKEIENRGEEEVKRWLDGVESEEEWADLMDRLLKW
ncbi:FAD/NAD(P)-binding domain-containing protein, partial [Thelephora ganbajun]